MPSHQDRREPLPADYQYGDTGRKMRFVQTLLESACDHFFHQWWLAHPDGPAPTYEDLVESVNAED